MSESSKGKGEQKTPSFIPAAMAKLSTRPVYSLFCIAMGIVTSWLVFMRFAQKLSFTLTFVNETGEIGYSFFACFSSEQERRMKTIAVVRKSWRMAI